jgi:hypothetical protein
MRLRGPSALALSAALCACGGSGDGDEENPEPINLVTFQAADAILGQTSATSGAINAGSPVNQTGLRNPGGHVGNGSLYVADAANNRVMGWNAIPTGLGQPADFVLGQADFTTADAGTSAQEFNVPTSCCVSGNALFVCDAFNDRVVVFSPPPTSDAPAIVALGKPDLDTGGLTAGQDGLASPSSVFVADNRICVADTNNERVMVWIGIPGSSGANAQLVVGQPDFLTTTPGVTASKTNAPRGTWTDGTRLVVADSNNHRVLIWNTFPTSNGEAADLVVGQPDFVTSTSGTGAQKMSFPTSVTSDGAQLFVADTNNHRVLVFSPFPTANNPAAVAVLGQGSFTNVKENDDDQNGVVDAAPTARTMFAPQGLTVIANQLFVADAINHRVLVFTGS